MTLVFIVGYAGFCGRDLLLLCCCIILEAADLRAEFSLIYY
jgi:hypothetical protein